MTRVITTAMPNAGAIPPERRTSDAATARSLLDAILGANRDVLPRFFAG